MKTPMFRAVARFSMRGLAGVRFLGLGALFAYLCISAQGQVDKTPVLHLSFDQVSGTTAGSIVTNTGSGGLGMNGTLNASVDGTVAIVGGGKFGNCLSVTGNVDANDSSVRVANAVVPLHASANWTVAMWIQTSTSGGAYAYQGDGGWADSHTMFYLNGGGGGGAMAGGVRWGQNWVTGTSAINDGLWHHIAVTCNGSTRNVYVDGVLETPGGDGDWGGNASGNQFWVGGSGQTGDGAAHLNGLVDEVYVFNQTLSLSDIQGLTNNIIPIVPVSVTANPASGYRGQTFTLTATVSPGAGTVTNVTANLSAINLSATANMVLSSGNVYTNSFTVPASSPIGARNLTVTAKTDTAPFVGSGGATFTVVALPPTNALIVTQLVPVSAYEYTEASFHFAATNDAPDAPFPMTYSWFTNSVLVSSNMGPRYTFLTTPADNGIQVQAIARVADANFSSLTVTSAVVGLTVISGTPVYTNGLKEEFFAGATRAGVYIGNVGPGVVRTVTSADSPGGFGDNATRRYSGFFIPQTTDGYVFFVAADDDTDVFLSTDSSPTNKLLIAQETSWSGTRNWQTTTASIQSQKRSDQWSPDGGSTVPYSGGIQLVAGQKYYFESVVHNGGGGDNWAVTYQTTNELAVNPALPLDGTASRMTATSNNIAFATFPGSTISWVTQPLTAVTVNEGQSTNFVSLATSDAEMVPFYQWYLNGAPIGGNTATLTLNAIPANYNNAQIQVVASTISGLSITSTVTTLTVIQSVFESGWVAEKKWMDVFNITGAENGTLGTPTVVGARAGFLVGRNNPSSNVSGSTGIPFNDLDSSLQQIGVFVAPASGKYAFFISSHDGGNLFLSTDNTPANKRLVAQEAGWTSGWNWNTVGGGGSVVSQKRSDTYSPDGGVTMPYSNGIPLVAGQKYYMEVAHTTSRWGNERCGVYYSLTDAFGSPLDPPADGTLANCVGTNVGMSAIRCTYVAFTQQPSAASVTTVEGNSVAFSVNGTSDSLYPIISSDGYTVFQPTNTLFYQWYKVLGGVTNAIPGATSRVLSSGPLTTADTGTRFFCTARALGYSDNALNPIWTNSQLSGAITVTARTPSLVGHWISGTASLADSANYVAPGVYDGGNVGGGTIYFTNDVPPGAPSGAQSLRLEGAGIIISNTATADAGYVGGTFDENIQNEFTIAFWAKGNLNSWDPWVSKQGESAGWQMRKLGWSGEGRPTFTMRGSGGDADPFPTDPFDLNQWHFYAGTFDTATGLRNLYVDGKLENQQGGQTPYTLASGSHLMLGGRDNGGLGSYYTGNLYDVRIYNYALTQQDVISVGGVPPPFDAQVLGTQLTLTWPVGTLLQATNVLGPWTTNLNASPVTIDMTEPRQFFRVRIP